VVVLDGSKVEEFDFEAASKRPLKGNIYLAKVTRVEPSLQAAFVEYGGNRQGFLAFNEIHPDYYQIPIADRQALLEEQQREARRRAAEEGFESVETGTAVVSDEELEAEDAAEAAAAQNPDQMSLDNAEEHAESDVHEEASEEEEFFDNKRDHGDEDDHAIAESEVEAGFDVEQADLAVESDAHDHDRHEHDDHEHIEPENPLGEIAEEEVEDGVVDQQTISEAGDAPVAEAHSEEHEYPYAAEPPHIVDPNTESQEGIVDEQAAAESFAEGEQPSEQGDQPAQPLQSKRAGQRFLRRRHYKIQEVIKRRQVMLVQVVKEERGNKGAALPLTSRSPDAIAC
jgi:ribonuclease E